MQKFASEIEDLSSELHRFDAARQVHEMLSKLLGEVKRTMFDERPPIEERKEGEIAGAEEVFPPKLTSLDIVAWAYLKEELTNVKDTSIVKHLSKTYPNLIRFVAFMDEYFARPSQVIRLE